MCTKHNTRVGCLASGASRREIEGSPLLTKRALALPIPTSRPNFRHLIAENFEHLDREDERVAARDARAHSAAVAVGEMRWNVELPPGHVASMRVGPNCRAGGQPMAIQTIQPMAIQTIQPMAIQTIQPKDVRAPAPCAWCSEIKREKERTGAQTSERESRCTEVTR